MSEQTTNQPKRDENISLLTRVFEEGIRPEDEPRMMSVELGHHVVNADLSPVENTERNGCAWLCGQLNAAQPVNDYDKEDIRYKLANGLAHASVGTAEQAIFSCGPYDQPGEARMDFEQFDRLATQTLETVGKRMINGGYHPSAKAADLKLSDTDVAPLLEERYAAFGESGMRLLRASAQTRFSIDYTSEADCMRKLRLANALAPLFSLICDSSTAFEGGPCPHLLMRTTLLGESDPERAGVVPGIMEGGFTFADYAAYLLDAPAGVISTGASYALSDKTLGEAFAETELDANDIKLAFSQFRNDVTLTQTINFEAIDSLPAPFVCAFATLLKALFFIGENLDEMDKLFAGVTAEDIANAKSALAQDGYNAEVYGRPAAELIDTLFERAQSTLAFNERNFLSALSALVRFRKTLSGMAMR